MRVQGYALPQVQVAGVRTRLYPHQAEMLNEWHSNSAFLLVTKTGSGKTRAVALPVLKNHESAVFVYPTNALIADQAQAIKKLMEDEGVTYREWTPDNANDKLGNEEYILVQVSAPMLEEFCKVWRMTRGGKAQKGEALKRILSGDKRRIVLVNPDVLFLIFSLKYRGAAESIGYLQNFATVVFDEFHLYNGVELAHALFMIHLARQMDTFKRVVLLSATPNKDVRPHLEALLKPMEINATASVPQPVIGERTVAHDVELMPLPSKRGDSVETARDRVLELLDELRQLQFANAEANVRGDYVPCVVILNSVVNAIALEDTLVVAGIARDAIAPIRGLSARSSRNLNGKLIVIGTSAIEVGIDFQADYLLFEAGDAASFMQRFGRIGRHRTGKAFLLCDYRESAALESMGTDIPRKTLERGVNNIYPQQDARAWFVATFGGMVSVCAQAYNFKRTITDDWSADGATKARVNQWMDEALDEYTKTLGMERILRQVRPKLKNDWFMHYAEIDSFRTSIPTVEVWDRRERYERGREPYYPADVKTLLMRTRVHWNEKYNRLEVRDGYNEWHYVWFAKSFEDSPDLAGTIRTTADYSADEMQFKQEGHLTSISHVMHKPKHHIFVFVPIELTNNFDWRIAWFRCGAKGRYVIAFDGNALILKEIYDQSQKTAL